MFLGLFLTCRVQIQILELSHFSDSFLGFNSLTWGHFQCDVCVIFLAFLIPMKDTQCFCLSWHFMWAITTIRLKHFSFLLLLFRSQHQRNKNTAPKKTLLRFPWSCHHKILTLMKRWKGKAFSMVENWKYAIECAIGLEDQRHCCEDLQQTVTLEEEILSFDLLFRSARTSWNTCLLYTSDAADE